jgi:hypothetical protein
MGWWFSFDLDLDLKCRSRTIPQTIYNSCQSLKSSISYQLHYAIQTYPIKQFLCKCNQKSSVFKYYNYSVVLVAVPGDPISVWAGTEPNAPVRVWHCQANETAYLVPCCYPGCTYICCFLARFEADCGCSLQYLHCCLKFCVCVQRISWHDQ